MVPMPQIITPPVTAFTPDGALDLDSTRRAMELAEPAVDGVFAMGTTGEFPAVERHERLQVIEIALDVFGPDRTIAHVGGASAHQALQLLDDAQQAGVRRHAAITPYYLTASDAGVLDYYQQLRSACRGELYVYAFPDVACSDVSPELLGRLTDEVGVDGIKVSGTASTRVDTYRAAAPTLPLWSGNDADLPHVMSAGGLGTVSGVSGVVPEAFVALRDAIASGDASAVDSAQQTVVKLVAALGPSITRLKRGLALRGIPTGPTRMSIDHVDDAADRQIREALEDLGVLA